MLLVFYPCFDKENLKQRALFKLFVKKLISV
jgi:hypothetical protein